MFTISNKLKIKKNRCKYLFFRFLFLLVFTLFAVSCYGVRSKYSETTTNNEKICIFVNIYDEDNRNYFNRLKDYPNIGEIPDCDYLLYSMIDFMKTSQSTVSGVYFTETVIANARYKLYKFDKTKSKKIMDIINNPDIISFKKSTGMMNSSLSRSKTFNEIAKEQVGRTAITSSIKMMERKLDNIVDIVGMNNFTDVSSYTNNLIIITSNIQAQKDAKKQLINSISQRVMDYAMFDILECRGKKNNHSMV